MQQEIGFVLILFAFFLITGVFGGFGVYSLLNNKKNRAKWSFSIGFLCVIVYIVGMFSLM
ncbi:hypothetical protein [Halalkalibacter urbisdiaboli]|uniref:hypothetical protein n=1 Tax=Halalkalibacter urbisdiaboli TaxID=1960589 RepID=UPI000B43EE0E|nr:hypothetical protein [Halalkalibacter urbisdiaboli]